MFKVEYEYYRDEYFGKSISEEEFPRYMKLANKYISPLTYQRVDTLLDDPDISEDTKNKVRDAYCAIGDLICVSTSDDGVTTHGEVKSESIGPWSRSYTTNSDSSETTFESKVYSKLNFLLAGTGLLYAGEVCL